MANTVTLTFAGETKSVESAFDRVGSSAETMDRRVRDSADGFDRVGEAADDVDTKAMGFRDTLTGVQDSVLGVQGAMKGDWGIETLLLLGFGVGDLASGMFNFLVPALKSARTAMMGLNLAFLTSPITWIIIGIVALVAIFVVLWVKCDWFRAFWIKVWNIIKGAASKVWDWIKGNWPLLLGILTGPIGAAVIFIVKKWDSIVGFVKGLPKKIGKAASGMWDGIKNAFKGALNWIIGKWNSLNFKITIPKSAFGIPIPGGGSSFGFGVPRIPKFHSGGTVPGAPGSEMLAVLQAGERVIPAGGGGAQTVNLLLSGEGSLAGLFLAAIRNGDLRLTVAGGRVVVSGG